MENDNNPLLSGDSEQSASTRIRENFSMDEIQKLLANVSATISAYTAKQKGIDPENMVRTIRGGRIIWITVDEMNAILSKQRRITKSKHTQRSLRGEDNLSNEISRRIEACRSLIDAVRKVSPETRSEFTRLLRTLESLQNLTVSHARQVHVLEAAIQRKRKEDPILQEVDKATEEMMEALKENAQSDMEVCQSFCDRHMDEYLARQKRIQPYINKAREYRLSFLLSKQQLFQLQFELIEKSERILSSHIEEIVYYDKEASFSGQLVQNSKQILSLLTDSRSFFLKLSALLPDELEAQKDLFLEADKNHLTPLFDCMASFTDLFNTAWKEIMEKKKIVPISTPLENTEENELKVEKVEKRMVYGEIHETQ